MKTYTLEELKLAQAKGCRIEAFSASGWHLVIEPNFKLPLKDYRIHPADEWKACLPRLKDGAEWHRNDFTNEMLEGGYRPLLHGEVIEEVDEFCYKGIWEKYNIRTSSSVWIGWPCLAHYTHQRTRRPVPPEFLHPDELARQLMNTQTDTPETDAQGYGNGNHPYVSTDFARPIAAEARQERPVGFNSALETWGAAEATPPVSDKEIADIQTEVANNLFSAALPEPVAQVPLGPEDVPPGSVFRNAEVCWYSIKYVLYNCVCIDINGRDTLYYGELKNEGWQINTSIPDTGRWDKDAWRPCSKPAK